MIPDYVEKGWEQPHKDEILVCEAFATMPQKVFDQLKEYSSSEPTGLAEGKMWKCCYINRQTAEMTWYLRWYVVDKTNERRMLIHARKIIIGDWKSLAGIS